MKPKPIQLGAICLLLLTLRLPAATFYVDVNSTNPVPPFATWSTAATDIQSAIDASSDGDLILVTNGVYQTGGRVVYGSLTNRVAIDKAVTVQSVNGPAETTIQGYQVPGSINGSNAVRCAYLTDGANLTGFTLTGGATLNVINVNDTENQSGGGVWCETTDALVSNCVITADSCFWYGAGAYGGTLNDCQIINNTNLNPSLGGGGGAAFAALLNSSIEGNRMNTFGGGVFSCTLSNCMLNGNSENGAYDCVLDDCTISGNTTTGNGGGASFSTLNDCLLCNNAATNYGGGAYDCVLNDCTVSNNWANRGGGVYCDNFQTNAPGQTNVLTGNAALFDGGGFWLGAGFLNTNWNVSSWTFTSNSAARDGGGLYLTSARSTVEGCDFEKNFSGRNGGGLCGYPSLTIVSNGTFSGNIAIGDGGGAYSAALDNCLVIGNQADSGGGVYGSVSGCVLDENIAISNGGGAYVFQSGSLGSCISSVIKDNTAGNGGGVYNTSSYAISNCIFRVNMATNDGGAVSGGRTLVNCLLVSNSAAFGGGAAENGDVVLNLHNCTLVGNSAVEAGGGAYSVSANNSIVYYNTAPTGSNYSASFLFASCCTTPLPQGTDNITNAPDFVDLVGGNYRLQTNSLCINTGNNSYASATGVDLDGRPRIVGDTVDLGAYEFQGPGMGEFIGWLQQYGLPTDGSADYIDSDGDGMNNYAEWRAGTNPTNAASVLLLASPSNSVSGLTVTWQSVSGVTYYLQSSTNFPAFTVLQSNLVGQAGTTSYTDTSATNGGPYFYRVGVQ